MSLYEEVKGFERKLKLLCKNTKGCNSCILGNFKDVDADFCEKPLENFAQLTEEVENAVNLWYGEYKKNNTSKVKFKEWLNNIGALEETEHPWSKFYNNKCRFGCCDKDIPCSYCDWWNKELVCEK